MSNTTISEYADNALLSEAAYADFSKIWKTDDNGEKVVDIDLYKKALIAEGFSATQAADFVSKYNVV